MARLVLHLAPPAKLCSQYHKVLDEQSLILLLSLFRSIFAQLPGSQNHLESVELYLSSLQTVSHCSRREDKVPQAPPREEEHVEHGPYTLATTNYLSKFRKTFEMLMMRSRI